MDAETVVYGLPVVLWGFFGIFVLIGLLLYALGQMGVVKRPDHDPNASAETNSLIQKLFEYQFEEEHINVNKPLLRAEAKRKLAGKGFHWLFVAVLVVAAVGLVIIYGIIPTTAKFLGIQTEKLETEYSCYAVVNGKEQRVTTDSEGQLGVTCRDEALLDLSQDLSTQQPDQAESTANQELDVQDSGIGSIVWYKHAGNWGKNGYWNGLSVEDFEAYRQEGRVLKEASCKTSLDLRGLHEQYPDLMLYINTPISAEPIVVFESGAIYVDCPAGAKYAIIHQ